MSPEDLKSYKPSVELAKWVTRLLVILIVIAVIWGLSYQSLIHYNKQYAGRTLSPLEYGSAMRGLRNRQSFVQLSGMCLGLYSSLWGLATLILIMVWHSRCCKNLQVFEIQGLKYSPALAALSFIIPLANFVLPYLIMIEVWKASGRYTGKNEDWRKVPAPALVILWLVFNLVAIVAYVWVMNYFFVNPPSPEDATEAAMAVGRLILGAAVVLVASAAWMAVVIVTMRRIAKRQEELYRDFEKAVHYSEQFERPVDEVLAMYTSGLAWLDVRKQLQESTGSG
jgi:NADH:ubiquinone oxidoreductase subunit 5 (subunit L)/multisubunit Na+/H+ antiporter MnhA subunit